MTSPRSDHARRAAGASRPRQRRPRYATREEQLRKLIGQLHERDGRVREALIAVLTGATPRVLAAVGTLLGFVDAQGRGRG